MKKELRKKIIAKYIKKPKKAPDTNYIEDVKGLSSVVVQDKEVMNAPIYKLLLSFNLQEYATVF